MIAYHSSNLILAQPFATRKDKHRIEEYNTIMTRLKATGLNVNLQVLDNEVSKDYKDAIVNKWKVKYQFQLVPPVMLNRNGAKWPPRKTKKKAHIRGSGFEMGYISDFETIKEF